MDANYFRRLAVLRCKACGKVSGIAASTGKKVQDLPDPFLWRCPHCGDQSTYRKTAITLRDVK